jgi:hypothetical protein
MNQGRALTVNKEQKVPAKRVDIVKIQMVKESC